MLKFTFNRRIALLLLVLIFGIGLLLSWAAAGIIRGYTLDLLSEMTAAHVEAALHEVVPERLFSQQLTSEDLTALATILHKDNLFENIVTIRVWDQDGRLVFADDPRLLDLHLKPSHQLDQVLRFGSPQAGVTSLDEADNQFYKGQFDQLVEVYIPIKSSRDGRVVGAYEVYWDFDEMATTTRQAYFDIWVLLSLGFAVIFFTLYTTIRKASQTLEEQSEALRIMVSRLEKTTNEKLSTLAAALDAKDNYTAGHSVRVANYALKIGAAAGLDKEKLKSLESAALLHDIGKIGIPEQVLNKPSSLSDEEMALVREHPANGAHIVMPSATLSAFGSIIKYHHERFDGTGYPEGLAGEAIPLESRILAVADAFDAMTSARPYRKAMSPETAGRILKKVKGTQLDPWIVDIFLNVLQLA